MTEPQRLFLVQARTDFAVFELLRKQSNLPACHSLHDPQMATELRGKAHAWRHGPNTGSHRAIVGFMRSLINNGKAQKQLGFERETARWKQLIRKSVPLVESIEELAPALSPDGPNAEYPWPREAPTSAPAEHVFSIWRELQRTDHGRSFLNLLRNLFASAEAFL